uniref:Protocadherin Fat 4-like n=1 Tax=Sinocyclocheilus rhinocerous TaxID=307959 RepID=A0A673KXN8_9TELE
EGRHVNERLVLFWLLIQVEDKGEPKKFGFLQVNVTIQDINDNPPAFDQDHYQTSVFEDTAIGSSVLQITATDLDEGANADIKYILDEGTPFQIDPKAGTVIIKEGLDYETKKEYSLTIHAVDNGVPSLSGRSEATIKLLDVNDNDPVVKFRYFPTTSKFASVDENAQVGTVVALLTVSDSDSSTANGNISVSILGGNEQRHFEVHSSTVPNLSLIKVASVLDRERISSYNLTVSVSDNGRPVARSSFASLVIFVNDINDHPPIFQEAVYRVDISEDIPKGSYIKGVSATDGDSGQNANLRYSLVSGNSLGWFAISENSGLVTSAAELDREIASQIVLNISAKDQGLQPKMSYTKLIVNITDVNDQVPTFTQSTYHISLVEHSPAGSELVVLSATDSDLGSNGTVRFSFDSETPVSVQNKFRLDAISGRLSTATELDREEESSYLLHIKATDAGTPSLYSICKVNITLKDINDNSPVFYPVQYFANIKENEPSGSFVTSVTASDPDLSCNGTVKYAITAGDSYKFHINSNSGKITTLVPLDREEKTSYQLQVTATDGGGLRSHTQAIVTATVVDMQDNPPVFSQKDTYHISLVEHSPAGSELVDLSATDSDLGANGTVRFSFDPETPVSVQNKFRLDAISGRLSTATELDREEEGFYLLHIKATDAGMPPLYSICKVNITLKDANDNSPVFYPVQYFANIKENEPSGSFVTSVTASDPDLGLNGTVKYAITAGDSYKFHINNNSGKIMTLVPLDREEKTAYQLQVTATDGGGLRSDTQAIVTVTVVDTQDNPPVFSQKEYSFVMFENVAADTIIGTVSATTVDLNTNITYLIASGDQRGLFAIKGSTGQITASGLIDREEQAFYQLRVIARGGEVMGEALVNITVKDLNDNAPHFIHNVEHVSAVENWATGHHIFQAKASDPDEGTNGMVIYSLKQNPKGLFHIHERHGLITLTSPLEVTTSSYQVEVMASDLGVPQRTASLILTISVYDVNDNAPVFDQLSYEVTILESEPVNSRFFKVEASDKDSGLNGEIVYDIVSGNTNYVFGIFPDGQLYIKADLDREVQDRYSLLVVAKDRAVEPLSANVNVTILLDDVNDNRPLFNSTNYVFHFEEEQERGSFVGLVFAEDKDFGPNSEVRYSFETPQPNFELNAISGALTSTLQLDRESLMRQRGAAVFSFTVVSSDQGLPKPLKDQAKVQVYIQDINDNPPKFTKDIYQASISESAQNMTQLLRVLASDVDENKNGLVRYDIMEGNEEKQFSIDSTSGQVTLVGKLDYETTPFYSLKIMAEDSGIVPLSSTCVLSISVLDDNDNSPSFPKSTLTVDVLENMRIGELVASVTATDSDSGSNADITYSISATNNHGTFSISANTGTGWSVRPCFVPPALPLK